MFNQKMETREKGGNGIGYGCLFSVLLALFCIMEPDRESSAIGDVTFDGNVTIETLGSYTVFDAVQILQFAGLQASTRTTCGFFLYRIIYPTTDFNGDTVPVSGLCAIPDQKEIRGIVSWQHGTCATRGDAPSAPTNYEGVPIAAFFADDGYILLAPDYIGLGVSEKIPRYLHTECTVSEQERNKAAFAPGIALGLGYDWSRILPVNALCYVRPVLHWRIPDRNPAIRNTPSLEGGICWQVNRPVKRLPVREGL